MFTILILLSLSAAGGIFLRRNNKIAPILSFSVPTTVIALLLSFGVSIGSNDAIIENIQDYGLTAATIAIFGAVGSILGSLIFIALYKKGGRK